MLNQHQSPLPSAQDTLLLKAALLKGQAALAAFAEWRKTLDLDALDFGSQRVLPLLSRNLRSLGVDDPIIARFKGVGRFSWYQNQVLVAAISPLLNSLNQAGIPFALLKGIAFVASIPDQMPLRAMTDVDLLVRPMDVPAAMDNLADGGWSPYYGTIRFAKQELIDREVSCDFSAGRDRHVDLHWFVRKQNRWPNADAALWSRLVPVKLGDVPCRALCFEDQVLHACIHGAPWNGVGTIRWVTDATVILRERSEGFDWAYLLDQCKERRAALQLRHCLAYLRDMLNVPVPDHVLDHLRREPVSLLDRIDYRLRARNPETLPRPAQALLVFQEFRGRERDLLHNSTIRALCAWIEYLWVVDSVVPAAALAIFAALNRPPWLRALIGKLCRGEVRAMALTQRMPAKISDGPIDLSMSGNPKRTLLYGWSEPEASGRWTDGPDAVLAVQRDRPEHDLTINFSLFGMLAEAAPNLDVEVWSGRHRLDTWKFAYPDTGMQLRTLQVPSKIMTGRFLVLTFVIREPRSPSSLGISSDVRRLGIHVRRLTFDQAPEMALSSAG